MSFVVRSIDVRGDAICANAAAQESVEAIGRRMLLPGLAITAIFVAAIFPQSSFAQSPHPDIKVMLVRNAITAVNHGNLTGNYTVLRDLGGPSFRERNSAAQLGGIFQALRQQKIDLSPTLVLDPQFTEPPAIDAAGTLHLIGYFPTQPLQVQFRLAFQQTAGSWTIDSVAIGATPAPGANAPPTQR